MDGVLGVDADGVGTIYRSYDASLKDLRSRLVKLVGDHLATLPGSKYDYNNSDFLLLQMLCEEVTHQHFETLLQSRIFSKANMKRTHLARWDKFDASFVRCYQQLNHVDVPLGPFNMAIYGGAAGVISSPDDLGRWMRFTLSDPTGKRMLDAGSQFGGFQGFGGYAFETSSIAKALSKDHKEQVFERPGAVNGYGLQVSFIPERRIAVAVFSNREGEKLGSIFEGKGIAFDLIIATLREKTTNDLSGNH